MELIDPISQYRLRACRESDAPAIYKAAIESIDHVSPWMPWLTPSYSLEDAIKWTRSAEIDRKAESRFEFIIIDSVTGDLCGVCGLNQINSEDRVCNLGYWVRRSKLRQGAASAAARMLRDFGLKGRELERLETVVAEGNTASRKVAEKVGALYEGIQRKRLRVGEQSYDAHMYAFISP